MNKDKLKAVFKSQELLADTLGMSVVTIKSWYKKGRIPLDHHIDILMSERNVNAPEPYKLTAEDL